MSGFVKVLVASGCAMLSGGVNVWLNVRDKKTITKRDIMSAFISPIRTVVSSCALLI